MIEKHTIKSDKQENGLWGTPFYLKSIDGSMISKDTHRNELFSAIIMSFAECQKQNFSLEIKTDNHFILKTDRPYFYNLDSFGIIGNTLYFLPTDEDRKIFNRTLKLKKLSTNKK